MQETPLGVKGADENSGWRGRWRDLREAYSGRDFLVLAIAAILLLGASMRFTGVDWDQQTHLHPDERFLTDVTSRLGWPGSLGEYFDEARSPLNPYNRDVGTFVYGTAPIFFVKWIGLFLDQLKVPDVYAMLTAGQAPSAYSYYWRIHLVGRVVSAGYDLVVVLLVFLIGRRLYGRWVGLLAALLMSCTVLNIQHSHFYVVEPYITLMATLAMYYSVRVVQEGRWQNWALLGVSFGLAMAGKISMAFFAIVIGGVCLLRALQQVPVRGAGEGPDPLAPELRRALSGLFGWLLPSRQDGDDGRAWSAFGRGLLQAGAGLALVLAAALLTFRIAQPYAFQGPGFFGLRLSQRWLDDMSIASRTVSGAIDMPPSHQWTDRAPILFSWRNMVLWGMGVPLGLAAWLGWLVAAVELIRRRKTEHLLLLLWVALIFVHQSTQFVKVVRYFLPIYPMLVLLAAYFLTWLWRQGQALSQHLAQAAHPRLVRIHPAPAALAACVVVVVALGTFLYAQAYTNIYRRPLSRVTASRWVYANIPQGARITFEEWDDIVPVNIDGKDAGQYYRLIKTAPYWEDSPEKRDALLQWLDEADYIIFSSNRLYGSIPRLPERYPLTTAYYRYLFSGDLGFQVIKKITSYPNLGPIEFPDDTADEAFTVYDHPQVTILKKTEAYSSARARALLGSIPVERLVRMSPVQTMRSRHGLMLSQEERQAQEEGGTWSAMFDRDSLANRLPLPAWLLVTEFLALAAFPLAFVAFPRFRDRGFVFAKALGVLGAAYLAWLGASLKVLPFTRTGILFAVLLLTSVGGLVAWRRWAALSAFVRRSWRTLVLAEGLYLAFFGAFLLVRLGNPDLWHPAMGGEKPMDLAYLNAIIKSTWFPPYDPWFAGGYINYYYFGHVIVATLCKLAAIVPTTAYNLALPTLFALTAAGMYSVVSNLLGPDEGPANRKLLDAPARAGLFAAVLVAVMGNLGQVRLLLNGLWRVGEVAFRSTLPGVEGLVKALVGLYRVLLQGQSLGFRPEWWYWNASRVMGAGEINEFPFFTFLYADLHAHLIALPFAVLALGLTVSLLLWPVPPQALADPGASSWLQRLLVRLRRSDWGEGLTLGLLALTLGELRVNNTWDYPTYLLVALAGLVFARLLRPEGVAWEQFWRVVGRFLVLVAVSTLLFQPFHGRYGAAYTSVEVWKGPRTEPGDYWLIHGLFLFILTSYSLSRAFGREVRGAVARTIRMALGRPLHLLRYGHLSGLLMQPTLAYQLAWYGVVATLAVAAFSVLVHWWLVGLVLPLGLVGMALVLRRALPPAERFASLLFVAGLLLTLLVEVLVLRGDIGRMNTVFKFYLQVWVLWSVAAAVGLSVLMRRVAGWPSARQRAWQVVLSLLLCGAALYPLTATPAKVNDRFDRSIGASLDGTAYARTAVYHDQGRMLRLEDDMEAIRWLQDNVRGSPVILEAVTPLYRWGSRVSVYTGLPTVLGWDWHQKQQRAVVSGEVVDWRVADVQRMYDSLDETELRQLLASYHVHYVYVGELERAYYSPEGLAKFDRLAGTLFDVVYRKGPVAIYRVRQEGLGGLSSRPFLLPRAGGGASGPILSGPVDQLPVIADRGWNSLANAGPLAAVLVWWLTFTVLGWAAWLLVLPVFRGLPDGGYLAGKVVGWLLLGYGVWLVASLRLATNTVATSYGALALILAAAMWQAYRQRRQLAAWLWGRRWLLLREEALFTAAFGALVLVRLLNPDLWQPWFGGEKMMEIAYLNAVLKSAHFPPYDPYFAGGHINYYYFGLQLVGVLIKLTGIVPEVAYNLAVPTFFALVAGLAFACGHALTFRVRGRRWLWGGAVALLGVAVAANLTVLVQWLAAMVSLGGRAPRANLADLAYVPAGVWKWLSGGARLPPFDYWYQATRIIPHTINEFPFFSYLFADLHPHMMSLPFTILVLLLLISLALPPRRAPTLAALALIALTVGVLGPMNTWDLPTYLGLTAVVLLWLGLRANDGAWGLVRAVWVVALAYVLFLPFYARYYAPAAGLRWAPSHTGFRYFVVVWGLWLVAGYGWLLARSWRGKDGVGRLVCRLAQARGRRAVWRWWRQGRHAGVRSALGALVLVAAGTAAATGNATLALVLPLVGLALDLWLRSWVAVEERLGALFAAAGWLILAALELVFVADFMQGSDWQRMNTVFKFGMQAWVLLAVSLAAGLPWVLTWLRSQRPAIHRVAWAVCIVALAATSLAYAPLGIAARVAERTPGGPPPVGTLDGLAFMQTAAYHWPDQEHTIELRHDLEAIRWLQANVTGTPVIAEAAIGYYREGGMRVSSYTGLPTLCGMHQAEQRDPALVYARQALADELYRTADVQRTLEIMRNLRVRYVYMGQLEILVYGVQAAAKFAALAAEGALEVAYANPGVTIYRFGGF
ncbi:MAG: DUF2298 domain-containing protein [Anaerolineae bacterium]